MNCRDAQDHLLESFDVDEPSVEQPELALHLRTCSVCAEFAESQRMLDGQLRSTIWVPDLSSSFRKTLEKRIRQEQRQLWVDYLPDVTYVAGSVATILLCIALLPVPAHTTVWVGAFLAVAAYSLEDILVSSLRD